MRKRRGRKGRMHGRKFAKHKGGKRLKGKYRVKRGGIRL